MSSIIRENDFLSADTYKARLTPQNIDDALEHVEAAQRALQPLARDGERKPEVLRALRLVESILLDAQAVDTPCCKCGGTDAPLHPSGQCGHCGPAEGDK